MELIILRPLTRMLHSYHFYSGKTHLIRDSYSLILERTVGTRIIFL